MSVILGKTDCVRVQETLAEAFMYEPKSVSISDASMNVQLTNWTFVQLSKTQDVFVTLSLPHYSSLHYNNLQIGNDANWLMA